MALVLRRDAGVFYNPPLEMIHEGRMLTCFSEAHFIDEDDGSLVGIKSWWTREEIQENKLRPMTEYLPPASDAVHYFGPVWPDDPKRTRKVLKEFLITSKMLHLHTGV